MIAFVIFCRLVTGLSVLTGAMVTAPTIIIPTNQFAMAAAGLLLGSLLTLAFTLISTPILDRIYARVYQDLA